MTEDLADKSLTAEEEVFVFPVSFAQQRLWFLDQLVPGNPFYNVPTAVRLIGSLDIAALEHTFNEIVRRHEALRTTFRMVSGQPVQVIAPSLSIPLPVVDLQQLSVAEREAQVKLLATAEFQHPFDLAQGPLLRVKLLQLSGSEHVLVVIIHHIVADGWSIGVLMRELRALYAAKASGQPSPLADLPIQYADFAHWQRQWLQAEVLTTQLAYWQHQLAGCTSLDLPTKTRPALPTFRGTRQYLMLPTRLSKAIATLSEREGVTLFMTLLAAFQTLLYRYTGQEDILIGSPIANRNRSEIEGLIGFFVNSLVLRTDLSGNPTFRELIRRVREVTLGAYAHQDLPFERLVEELQPERDLNRNPLFQVVFALQNAPLETLELPGLTLSPLNIDPGTARFDLEFQLVECLDSLGVVVVYSTDLFDQITITRMLEHFQALLESIVTDPQQRLANLSLLTEIERHQLLSWNHNQADYPKNLCIHQRFEAQVERSPEAVAVVFESQQLTYQDLNRRSNKLAHYLRKLGVGPEVLVGIYVERSVEMIVGVLGILKAGGAYLPLDPTYPQQRLSFMLSDSQVSILLTQQRWVESLVPHEIQLVCLDKDILPHSPTEDVFDSNENPYSLTNDNLAYVIYTSGSTGKPKGVLSQHQGLYNLAQAQHQVFNLKRQNRILQFASLSFDASIFEIVMALGIGATLCLAREESLKSGAALLQLLQDRQITNVTLPPTVLSILPAEKLPALEIIVSAGEACSADIARRWATASRQFFNAYGVTEATIWSTTDKFGDSKDQPPAIGQPIANTQVYLLDSQLQPVPFGARGELYISGSGLARGYLNRPELTAESFIPHPWSQKPGVRLYKTGDIARYRADGKIEFLGRMDSQVKLRGFRLELGEIESLLGQHPAVQQTVVIVREDVPGNNRLVAYVVLNQQALITSELRCFLKQNLPDYMVPSTFVVLEALPLTPNGKVDRQALPIPEKLNPEIERAFVAPRTPMEEKLAHIWAQLLNLEQVGIHDNFFELGGDSLLTMRLMDQIYNQLDQQLPLSELFLAPTIERLASRLQPETDLHWSPLVTIQPNGSKPPFFCVHPILGVVFPYYELARHLGSDQPFYALQPLSIDGEGLPHTRIEDMASYYIKALRLVQPQGPYFIGGWSFGGLVAFEMAQQLQKGNHQVALLAMLDTPAPVAANRPSFGDGFRFLLNTAVRSVWPYILDYFYLLTAPDKHQGADIGMFRPTIRPILRVFQASSQAALSYIPQVYSNPITLLRTSEQPNKADRDPTMGWSGLAVGGVEVHTVPGNHLTMLRQPHVQVLAEKLRLCLDKAQPLI